MTQLFSYYGGKIRLAHKIIPHIPKHTIYVEPFCGGASIFFKKPWPDTKNGGHYREVINDTNQLVYNFYKTFRDKPDELIFKIENTPYSKDEYNDAFRIVADKDQAQYDNVTKAWSFYVAITQTFGKKINGRCWGRAMYGANLSYSYHSKIKALGLLRSRLDGVHIDNKDALEIIKDYDAPQTFFYLDPPYIDTDQRYHAEKNNNVEIFSQEKLIKLLDLLKDIKGSFILSHYKNEILDSYGWKRVDFETKMSVSGVGKTRALGRDASKKSDQETLNSKGSRARIDSIYIKQASPVRPEIQALYDSGKFDCFLG